MAASPGLAGTERWIRRPVPASGRILDSARPAASPAGAVLTVFIEGDGRAFDRHGRPRPDPTPRRATGLDLARAWPRRPVAWLGRMCQFVHDPACKPHDWTDGRFTPEAIRTTNAAIDALKAEAGATRVVLAGWSGGGALAVLAAAERDDVAGVATFAAPLDLDAWTRWHGLHRPAQWLNPSDAKLPASASQAHVLGAFDTVAPPGAALAAARRLAGPQGAAWVRAERHDCCWRRRLAEAAAHVDPRPDGLDLSDGRADAPISR